jgi:hypothetical protein
MTSVKDLQKVLDEVEAVVWATCEFGSLGREKMNVLVNLFSAFKAEYEKVNRDLNFYREANIVLERDFVLVRRKQLEDMVKEFKADGTAFLQKYGYCQIRKFLEAKP